MRSSGNQHFYSEPRANTLNLYSPAGSLSIIFLFYIPVQPLPPLVFLSLPLLDFFFVSLSSSSTFQLLYIRLLFFWFYYSRLVRLQACCYLYSHTLLPAFPLPPLRQLLVHDDSCKYADDVDKYAPRLHAYPPSFQVQLSVVFLHPLLQFPAPVLQRHVQDAGWNGSLCGRFVQGLLSSRTSQQCYG